jgi:hypothetical protein
LVASFFTIFSLFRVLAVPVTMLVSLRANQSFHSYPYDVGNILAE